MDLAFNFNFHTFIGIMVMLFCIYLGLKVTKLIFKLGAGAVAIMALIYLFQNIL